MRRATTLEMKGHRRRAILAIARRDAAVYFSYPMQLVLRLAQLFIVVVTLHYVSRLVHNAPELEQYRNDYFSFALSGILVISFVTLGLAAFSSTLADEQHSGTLETLLSYPISPMTLLIGSLVVPLGLSLLTNGVLVAVGVIGLGFHISASGVVLAVPVLLLTMTTFGAAGVLSATFVLLAKRGDPITGLVAQLSTFFAGAIFPVALLPSWSQHLARLVPAYYSLHGVREALLAGGRASAVAGDAAVLTVASVVLLPLSLVAYRAALRVAARAGTLGTY